MGGRENGEDDSHDHDISTNTPYPSTTQHNGINEQNGEKQEITNGVNGHKQENEDKAQVAGDDNGTLQASKKRNLRLPTQRKRSCGRVPTGHLAWGPQRYLLDSLDGAPSAVPHKLLRGFPASCPSKSDPIIR